MTARARFLLFSTSILATAVTLAVAQNDSPGSRSDERPEPREAGASAPEQPPEKTPLQKFMRVKLKSADLVLEGLVTGKFALIQKGADEFQQVSEADQWRASNDAMYRQYSREFQAKVKDLHKAAQDKDIDRTALAWIDTTLSCVECHKWVNAMLIAQRVPFPAIGPRRQHGNWTKAVRVDTDSADVFTASTTATRTGPDDSIRPAAVPPEAPAAEPEADQGVNRFMREKLASAQDVLEGVLVEDFRLVTTGARRMAIMSQAAEWHVFDTPEYREDSAEFRAKCRQLLKAADEQRTDAAALSYVQVTLSCVRCHQHMRQKRVAASDASRPVGIAGIDR